MRKKVDDDGLVEPAEEGAIIQELRSLGRAVQAILVQVEQKLDNSQSPDEWMQVALIIDRLLFGIYLIFLTVSFFTITVIWINSYNRTA